MTGLGRAVVVGGRGVIGAAIVRALRGAGWDVLIGTHDPRVAKTSGFRFADLDQPDSLREAVAGAEVVVQSVNFPTYPVERRRHGHTYATYDGSGTECLVETARQSGARRYLFVSGVGAGQGSAMPYFRAIDQGERAVSGSGLEWVCLRPAFAYGPGDRGINKIIQACRWLPAVPLPGSGRQLHQPVHVDDVGLVAALAAMPGAPQGVFEVGGPERMTLREMLHEALAAAAIRRPFIPVPHPLARLGGSLMQLLPGPPMTAVAVDFACEDFVADLSALQASFEVALTPFRQGLASYLGPARRRSS
jgi:uncharacterized protein YbjT (DUF2867 family)